MKIKLWKYFIDEESTEKWLNDLAAEGLNCVGSGFLMHKYYFEQDQPGEYTYRIVILDHAMGHPETTRYLNFLREGGVEYIASGYRHFILRKKTADGPFELHTDRASLIKKNKTLMNFAIVTALILLPIIALNVGVTIMHLVNRHIYTTLMVFINAMGAAVCFVLFVIMCTQWRRYALRKRRLQEEGAIHE
ncbi:MAG: DUF2812 domain-containing protein [Defluviitaleaceae bacterium]|nr:DUF2812 domain-containing protein [Defluviitaleaceae bacterium]